MWNRNELTERIGLRYPIIQGPFGGGFSTPALVAAVSNAGGLGSFGAHGLRPEKMAEVAESIRAVTAAPFAMNLWVSVEDPDARANDETRYESAFYSLAPLFEELGIDAPRPPFAQWRSFEEEAAALLEAAPPVFSFIYGVPGDAILEECRRRGIVTVGAATTVEEAIALDGAGVDAIVATGFEAGGHRVSWLGNAEDSLVGTMSLVPQIVDSVRIPVIAAGGIADARGVCAALALGASGVQIGTAFLGCEESNASDAHRDALFGERGRHTVLTRAFTGRLARSIPNRLTEAHRRGPGATLPYPLQRHLTGALRAEATRRGSGEFSPLWAGQSAALLHSRRATELFEKLVLETDAWFGSAGRQKG